MTVSTTQIPTLRFITHQVGEFSNPAGEYLEQGQTFRLDLDSAKGDSKRVMLPHPEIIDACEIGHVLMVDDGKVKLTVTGKGADYLDCHVDVNGKISNRKVRPAERMTFVEGFPVY
jgi:pyruvate kinase